MNSGTLVVGSISQDFVDGQGAQLRGELGGSATYFALAARHFGPVAVVAVVGTDREADARATLAFADLSRLAVSPAPTYTWRARREPGGDAVTLDNSAGAADGWTPDIRGADDLAPTVFLASTSPKAQLRVAEKAHRGISLAGDTMDVYITAQRPAVEKMVGQLRFLLTTETELQLLSRTRGVAAGTAWALDRYRLEAIVVKRGAAGAILATREANVRLPAFPVDAVDPTGAGDALAGGFLGRLEETGGRGVAALVEALCWGMAAASFCVAAAGVQGLVRLDRPALAARLAEYRALELHPGEPRQA